MRTEYSKPSIRNSNSMMFECCYASTNLSSDIPDCPKCYYGVDVKEATNAKCRACMNFMVGDSSLYDICNQR